MRDLRVLHVIPTLMRGGAETVLARFVSHSNVDNRIATFVDSVGIELPDHISVCSLGANSPYDIVGAVRGIRQVSGREPYDLLVGWLYQGAYATALASVANQTAPPVMWSIHHTPFRRERFRAEVVWRAAAFLSRRAEKIIYCATTARQAHERVGYSRRAGLVISNGVDTDLFRPSMSARTQIRAELRLPSEGLVFGSVGRYDSAKNQEGLIRAFCRHHKAHPTSHLLMVGRGVDTASSLKEAVAQGSNPNVHLLGERADIPDLLNALDVYVQASLGEAFPVALAEGMSTGLPCLATPVGDTSVLLPPGAGHLLAATTQSAIEEGLNWAARQSREELHGLGVEARRVVASQHSLTRMVNRFDSVMAATARRAAHD